MGTPLRVLVVEDSEEDALLLLRELRRRGYDPAWTRVDTAEAMSAALDEESWDIILADYALPQFSGPAALELLQEAGLDLPFIIVSDPVGEEAAVAAMRAGAGDYILRDNLTRLAAAVERELREAEVRRAHKRAGETIRLQGEIVHNMAEGVQLVRSSDGVIVYVNPAVERMFGYDRGELVGKPFSVLQVPGERSPEDTANDIMQSLREKGVWSGEVPEIAKDGTTFWCHLNISSFDHPEYGQVWVSVVENITERKQAEEALGQLVRQWQDTFDAIEDLVAIIDKDYRIVRANEALRQAFPGERVLGANCYKLLHGAEAPAPNCPASQAFSTGQRTHAELREEHLGDCWLDIFAYPIKDEEGAVQQVVHVARDITEQKRSQEALREREEHLRAIFEAAKDVSFIITDLAGTEAKILEFSPGAEHIFGYQREEVIGKHLAILHLPENVAKFPEATRALREGKSGLTTETVLVRKSGETFPALLTLYPLLDENGDLNAVLGVTIDITERKRAEQERQLNFRRLQKIVEGAVRTMARIVEIRDPYTAGHQERVAALARAIAVELHVPEDQVAGLYMAGSIHDVGKISIPAEILSKPGRLTEPEFDMIKAHSFIGYDILSGIEFPWPIADIVLQHHERADGSGYPKGLTGEDIRLEARILGVADVVEAMASHRPYRPARGQDAALEEISQNKGVLYDPQVADACLKIFAEKRFTLEQGDEGPKTP